MQEKQEATEGCGMRFSPDIIEFFSNVAYAFHMAWIWANSISLALSGRLLMGRDYHLQAHVQACLLPADHF